MVARRCRWCGLPDVDAAEFVGRVRKRWEALSPEQRRSMAEALRVRAPELLALLVTSARVGRARAVAGGTPPALETVAAAAIRAAAPALRAALAGLVNGKGW